MAKRNRITTTATTTLALATLLIFSTLPGLAQSGGKPRKKLQVATVSISRIVDSYERTKNLNQSLKEKEEELLEDEKKLQAKLKEAISEFEAFKKDFLAMEKKGTIPKDEFSMKQLQEKQQSLILALQKQELLLARKRREATRDLGEAKRNSQILIVRDVLSYIRAKIALTDYDIVINMDEELTSDTRIDGGFMFARHRTDITDMIIQGINKQYRALPK